jgi:protein dithiol:quinone oxidoreductase
MTAPAVARPPPGDRRAVITGLFAAVALLTFGAVAVALVSQHLFAMEPCPWCVLQRLIFLAIGLTALLGLAWRSAPASRLCAAVGLLLALAGIGAALWQQFVAARSESCNLTLADRIVGATQLDRLLPEIFEARASCADAAVKLIGIPYALWAALVFLVCAIALVRVLRERV